MKKNHLTVTIMMFALIVCALPAFWMQQSIAQDMGCMEMAVPGTGYMQLKYYQILGSGKNMKLFVYVGRSGDGAAPMQGQIPVTDAAFDSIQASVLMAAKSPEMYEFSLGMSGTDNKICKIYVKPRIAYPTPTPVQPKAVTN
jgi:hypothetical protein